MFSQSGSSPCGPVMCLLSPISDSQSVQEPTLLLYQLNFVSFTICHFCVDYLSCIMFLCSLLSAAPNQCRGQRTSYWSSILSTCVMFHISYMSCVICSVSFVSWFLCYVSFIKCHVSDVICQMC